MKEGTSNLTPYLLFYSRAKKRTRANLSSIFLFSTSFPYKILDLKRTQTFTYARRLNPHYGSL